MKFLCKDSQSYFVSPGLETDLDLDYLDLEIAQQKDINKNLESKVLSGQEAVETAELTLVALNQCNQILERKVRIQRNRLTRVQNQVIAALTPVLQKYSSQGFHLPLRPDNLCDVMNQLNTLNKKQPIVSDIHSAVALISVR